MDDERRRWDDRRRWDERYADRLAGPALAPVGLGERPELVPAGGRALDVACGLGATAVWAARQGFEVVGVDVSGVAVDKARELAERLDVADRARFVVHDLEAGLPPVADGPFQLVVCQRYRQRDLYPALASRLAPGGVLAVTVLSAVGHRGRPGPFHAPEGELLAAFARLELVHHAEGAGEATLVARRPPG